MSHQEVPELSPVNKKGYFGYCYIQSVHDYSKENCQRCSYIHLFTIKSFTKTKEGGKFHYQIESQLWEEEQEEGQMKEAEGYFELKSESVGEEGNLVQCLMLGV